MMRLKLQGKLHSLDWFGERHQSSDITLYQKQRQESEGVVTISCSGKLIHCSKIKGTLNHHGITSQLSLRDISVSI